MKVLQDSKDWICSTLGVEPFAFVAPWNILKSWQQELAFKYYEQVRHPTFLHFHSRNHTDILNTIPKYIKGPCPARGAIRRKRYDRALQYVKGKFGCNFEGV